MRCVIVEDNPFTRMTLKAALEKMGNEVVGEAESIDAACKVLSTVDADVILLDLILPDGNGINILKCIKNKAKIIAITAVDQENIDKDLKENGVELILRKPFSYEDLEKLLKSLK